MTFLVYSKIYFGRTVQPEAPIHSLHIAWFLVDLWSANDRPSVFRRFVRGRRKRSQSRFAAYLFKKRSKSSKQFSRQNFAKPQFQGRCKGSWEVGKSHFPDIIFLFFFYFLRFLKARHGPHFCNFVQKKTREPGKQLVSRLAFHLTF